MAKKKTARDLIMGRAKIPTTAELLKKLPGVRRQVGPTASGRQYGNELQRNLTKPPPVKVRAKGEIRIAGQKRAARLGKRIADAAARANAPIPGQGPKPYVYNPRASQERMRAQARSPILLETIRRRLTGDRVGSPNVTDEDFNYLRGLDSMSRRLDPSMLGRLRRTIEEKLRGEIGGIKRALLKTGGVLVQTTRDVFEGAKKILAKLRGDTLKDKLAGFKLLGKTEIPTEEIRRKGFEKKTPYQAQSMIGVSSSNVASVGWEPAYQDEPISENTLGTLFIQFRNGWLYKYVSAPYWLYEAILRAPSKGKAVWGLIRRGLYPDGVPYGSAAVEGYERIV